MTTHNTQHTAEAAHQLDKDFCPPLFFFLTLVPFASLYAALFTFLSLKNAVSPFFSLLSIVASQFCFAAAELSSRGVPVLVSDRRRKLPKAANLK